MIGLQSCKESKKNIENPLEGEITITADESLQPIVEAQIMSYNAHYPKAKIITKYVPEQIAMNLMMNDSADIAIVTREFNKTEREYFAKRNIQYLPAKMALDGVALISNKESSYKKITLNELKEVLEGTSTKGLKLVFDNSSSSNLNVLIDKLKIKNLSKTNIYAANGNKDVVELIKKNKNAIGVIGNTWISDKDDRLSKEILNSVTVLEVSENGKDFYRPNLSNLKARKYPLERKIILHTKQHYGMSKGFTRFCCSQVGQLVVEKAGLLPYYMYAKQVVVDKKSVEDLQKDEKIATEKLLN
jgi:phosphate transport system substrate-binding protein